MAKYLKINSSRYSGVSNSPIYLLFCLVLSVFVLTEINQCAFCATDSGITTYEDISPVPDDSTLADILLPPEELKPLDRSRKMISFEHVPEEGIDEAVADTEPESADDIETGSGTTQVDPDTVFTKGSKKGVSEDVSEILSGATGTGSAASDSVSVAISYEKKDRPAQPERAPISGNVSLEFLTTDKSGNEREFLSRNGLLRFNDRIRQTTRIMVYKELDDGMLVEGTFLDYPYREPHMDFRISSSRLNAQLGDVTATFRGGPMTAFSKKVRGLDFVYDTGKFSLFSILSREKSDTRREAFSGRNFRGPYSLAAVDILKNSETVYLNGERLSRAEYFIDYFQGDISFHENLDTTDTVEITYETTLQATLKTGSLKGIGVFTDPAHRKYDFSIAYLEEDTMLGSDAIVSSVTEQIYPSYSNDSKNVSYADTGQHLYLSTNYAEPLSELVWVVKSGTTATEYLKKGIDYSIKYYHDNGGAEITLNGNVRFAAHDKMWVSYNYYRAEHLQRRDVEVHDIDGLTSEIVLDYERIFPGTEIVYYVDERIRRELIAGVDYEINVSANSIMMIWEDIFPNYMQSPYIEISYEYAPASEQDNSDSVRRIVDASGRYTSGDLVVRGELSRSESPVSLKVVQVIEERVATVTDTTQDEYLLQFPATRNTESIYFNDPVSPGALQRAGVDYTLIEESGLSNKTYVKFLKTIPVGTTIIANYSYTPDSPSIPRNEGEAARVTADYTVGRGSRSFEHMQKSACFMPLTSYNDLEKHRTALDLKLNTSRRWSFSLAFLGQEHASDLLSNVLFDTQKWNSSIKYTDGDKYSIKYSHEQKDRSDDRETTLTGIKNTSDRVDATYNFSGKKLTTSGHIEFRELDDFTDLTSDQKVIKAGATATYAPDEKFRLRVSSSANRIRFIASSTNIGYGSFISPNSSSVVDLMYRPTPLWTFRSSVDNQSTKSSNNAFDMGRNSIQIVRASIISGSFGSVKKLVANFDRRDRPGRSWGDSRSELAGVRITFDAHRHWDFTPGYSQTRSRLEFRSRGETREISMRADFRKSSQNGWYGDLKYGALNSNYENYLAAESADFRRTTKQRKLEASANYRTTSYNLFNTASFTSISGDNIDTRRHVTSGIDYIYSKKIDLNFTYNYEKYPYTTGRRRKVSFGSSTKLDDRFTLDVNFARDRLFNAGSKNYTSDLINMILDLKF